MDYILNQLSQIDVGNLLAFVGILWIFKMHLDKKFEQIEKRFERIELRLDRMEMRFDKIEREIANLDKRLIAVETTLRIQGGCRLNYDHHEIHKAE